MTDNSLGFLSHIKEQYQASIWLTEQKRRELVEQAYQSGLGVRGMVNQIRQLMDDELFFDFDSRQGITNVRFDVLDGSENVTTVMETCLPPSGKNWNEYFRTKG